MRRGLFSALDVARHVLTYCRNKGKPIANLRLQKTLYFLWIDFYKETGKWLFAEEFCAWKLGPVITDVYFEYNQNAGLPIRITEDADLGKRSTKVEQITEKYLSVSVSKLVDKSHEKGHAWDRIYRNGDGDGLAIPYPLIMELECK